MFLKLFCETIITALQRFLKKFFVVLRSIVVLIKCRFDEVSLDQVSFDQLWFDQLSVHFEYD